MIQTGISSDLNVILNFEIEIKLMRKNLSENFSNLDLISYLINLFNLLYISGYTSISFNHKGHEGYHKEH